MAVLGVIPARIDSVRLPGKMLLNKTGKPLIQYAWEAACRASEIDRVVIATDSKEIIDAAQAFGAEVWYTGKHDSGTSRAAEVLSQIGEVFRAVVNVQGDEPEVQPEHLNEVVRALGDDEMSTLVTRFSNWDDVCSCSCVKVVSDCNDRALYFSRSIIPHCVAAGPDPDSLPWRSRRRLPPCHQAPDKRSPG